MIPRAIVLPVEDAERRGVRAQRVATFLAALDPRKPWEVLVRPFKRSRSNQQNRALWGLAYEVLSEFTGHTKDELHEVFCRAHFGEIEQEVMGTVIIRPRRTTTTDEDGESDVLSTKDFAEFFAFVQMKAAEIGCYIEDPDPLYWMNQERAA